MTETMKKTKKQKIKPYRSTLNNALWSFRSIFKDSPFFFLLMVLEIPLNICLSYTEIYLPSLVVAEVKYPRPICLNTVLKGRWMWTGNR